MTSITSLDSVLQAGLDAAQKAHSHTVAGDKLADERAQILQADPTTSAAPHLLGDDNDRFAAKDFFSKDAKDPNGAADQRLSQALRSLAERFQAGQAAQAATKDQPTVAAKATAVEQTSGKELAYIGSWVGAATSSAPIAAPSTSPAPAPAPTAPAVTQPADTSSTSGSGTGSGTSTGSGTGSGTGTTSSGTTSTTTTSTTTTSTTTTSNGKGTTTAPGQLKH